MFNLMSNFSGSHHNGIPLYYIYIICDIIPYLIYTFSPALKIPTSLILNFSVE